MHEGPPGARDDTVQRAVAVPATGDGTVDPPVVADRYVLHRVLGVGGAAVVHEATDRTLDRPVAVKLLRDQTFDPRDRARFVSEARLLGRLSHPRLVQVLDAGIHEDRPYVVLELVRGQTLAQALDAGLPEERLAETGAAVAEALEHVHAAGIVHRDVKPGNVLLGDDGSVKLADFGIARLVDDTTHHTRTGTLVGTVAYLAPEQVSGEPATTAVDVYALGLVLLEGLTGRRAFEGRSVESALARLHRAPDVPDTLPRRWSSLLTAMTTRDPAARPRAGEVADLLRRGAPYDAVPSGLPTRRPTLLPRLALAGAAAAVAVLVGGVAGPSLSGLPGQAAGASAHRGSADGSSGERSGAAAVRTGAVTASSGAGQRTAPSPGAAAGSSRSGQDRGPGAGPDDATYDGTASSPALAGPSQPAGGPAAPSGGSASGPVGSTAGPGGGSAAAGTPGATPVPSSSTGTTGDGGKGTAHAGEGRDDKGGKDDKGGEDDEGDRDDEQDAGATDGEDTTDGGVVDVEDAAGPGHAPGHGGKG